MNLRDLSSYREYKNSGHAWIGAIPSHWELFPNRALFKERIEKGHEDEQMLSVTIKRGVIRQTELLENTSKKDSSNEDKRNYKLVLSGDIAYNKMRAWQGAVGASSLRGIVSPAYIVQTLRGNDNPDYFHYLLRTPAFATEAERWSYGITSDQWSLRPGEFKQIYCPRPPRPEQDVIVRFIDYEEAKVNRLVRAKRRVIELLNEQKQAIIHRAVTRGLDPNVRLTPSGVEWLKEIPNHWKPLRLARIIKHGPQNGISPAIDENGSLESFSISAIRDGIVDIRESDIKYVAGGPSLLDGTYTILKGDILIVRGNGNIRFVGRAGLATSDMGNRVYPDLLMRMRLKSGVDPEFIVMLLNDQITRSQVETAARTAVGTFKINNQQVRGLWVALPPIYEQRQIVKAIIEETGSIDLAKVRAADEIQLLNEYRTRLIADVVTGKLDVRGMEFETTESHELLSEADDDESEDSQELVAAGDAPDAD